MYYSDKLQLDFNCFNSSNLKSFNGRLIPKEERIHNRSMELIKNVSPLLNEKLNEFLSFLKHHPIIDTKKTAEALGCSYNTTAKYIDILCKKGILVQSSKVGKNKIFSYSSYLEILRKNA
jgi:DNA-binding MarR family transcriptional regulator